MTVNFRSLGWGGAETKCKQNNYMEPKEPFGKRTLETKKETGTHFQTYCILGKQIYRMGAEKR